MSGSAKTGIGILIVVIAIMTALVLSVLGDDGADPAAQAPSASETTAPPQPGPDRQNGSDTPLADITLDGLDGGAPVNLGEATAGRPALINLWAYWCAPCRHELPALQEFAARAGDAVTVLTVQSDPDSAKGRALLRDLGVSLPALADPQQEVATAVHAPPVLPVTVLLHPDGTLARVVAIPFSDADHIAEVVEEELGVTL